MLRTHWFMTWGIAGQKLVFPALATALAVIIALSAGAAGAESDDVALTVQVGNTGSQPAPAGVSCAEVSVGQVFTVDLRVENADNLIAYELRVTYDSSVLSLEKADFNHFLVSTPPYGQVFPSLFVAETADSHFLAAAETRGTADSGSGVLARLQMRAITEGMSEIGIQTKPAVYGPRLTNKEGKPIGDGTGDGIFDGTVLSGMAAVGKNCSGGSIEDPPVSDGGDPGPGSPPDDAAGSSDDDAGSGDDGAGSSDDGAGGSNDGAGGSDDGAEDGIAGGDGQDGDPADSADAGDSGAESGADTEDSDVAAANEGPNTDDSGLGEPGSAGGASRGDSGLNFLWYTLIVVGAAAVLGVLGLAMKSLRAR